MGGELDGGRPALETQLERGGRQRVHGEQQRQRVGVAAVREAEPAAHLALAGGCADGPADRRRVELDVEPSGDGGAAGDRGGAVARAEAVLHRRDGRRLRRRTDLVGQAVQVTVGGDDPDALDLRAVLRELEEGGLAGGEGAAGTDGLGPDHRGAGDGSGEVVRRDGERVRVRQGLAERAAQRGQQISAVDGVDDRPSGGEFGVVDAVLAKGDGGVAVELAVPDGRLSGPRRLLCCLCHAMHRTPIVLLSGSFLAGTCLAKYVSRNVSRRKFLRWSPSSPRPMRTSGCRRAVPASGSASPAAAARRRRSRPYRW